MNNSIILLIAVYFYLTAINYYGFRKLKSKVKNWYDYEGNFYLSFLMKKIGLLPTQITTFVFAVTMFLLIERAEPFLLGALFGFFFFNAIHDSVEIDFNLKALKKKEEVK